MSPSKYHLYVRHFNYSWTFGISHCMKFYICSILCDLFSQHSVSCNTQLCKDSYTIYVVLWNYSGGLILGLCLANETALLCNAVSHWLGASLEPALQCIPTLNMHMVWTLIGLDGGWFYPYPSGCSIVRCTVLWCVMLYHVQYSYSVVPLDGWLVVCAHWP